MRRLLLVVRRLCYHSCRLVRWERLVRWKWLLWRRREPGRWLWRVQTGVAVPGWRGRGHVGRVAATSSGLSDGRWRCLLPPDRRQGGNVEDPVEEDAGPVLLQHLVPDNLVVQHRGLDLQLWRLEGELHEGELVAALQLLRLDLDVRLGDPEGLAELYVGDEEGEFTVKVQQKDTKLLADNNPMLAEVSVTLGSYQDQVGVY